MIASCEDCWPSGIRWIVKQRRGLPTISADAWQECERAMDRPMGWLPSMMGIVEWLAKNGDWVRLVAPERVGKAAAWSVLSRHLGYMASKDPDALAETLTEAWRDRKLEVEEWAIGANVSPKWADAGVSAWHIFHTR